MMWHVVSGLCGFAIGATTVMAIMPSDAMHAEDNARAWMHSRGVHPTFVACPDTGKGFSRCTMYVPTVGQGETIQIFDCKTARPEDDDASACWEPTFDTEQRQ